MRRMFIIATVAVAGPFATASPVGAQGIPEPVTIVSGLDFPAGIAVSPDGTVFVTERAGSVRAIEDGDLVDEPVAKIPTVISGETGLLGLTLSPDGRAAYAFATEPDGTTNSVWRVPLAGSGEPTRVVEGLPAATYHNGGGVAFDGDGMLLVSNGEQHSSDKAQDPGALGGKVYRFTPTGDIPDDNPFGDSPTLALGLRNPYGLTVDPVSGLPWVTENGPQSFDEVNRIVEGGNYGWPVVSGPGAGAGLAGEYHDPVLAYEEIVVPTGLAFAGEGARSDVSGDLFFGTYEEGSIHRVRLDPDRTGAASDEVVFRGRSVIGVAWGPRGLYFTTPDSVMVIDLVEDDAPEPTETPSDPPVSPRRTDPATSGDGDDDGGLGLVAVLVLVALASGFLLMRRRMETTRKTGL